jgi:flagellar M-ring protein FliF
VHLALPNQNGFFREQQKPGASVLVTLHPGRTLDRAQVAGIVHLVSSSVPELHPKAVSVIDQTGALLSGPTDSAGQGLDAQQLQYVQQVEQSYVKRITELLEPVVGRDNLRATVTAEVDFSQTESTSELFKPNQGSEPAAVRSMQSTESSQATGAAAGGVPGAASNQPPVPPTAEINGKAPPLHAAQGGGSGSGSARRDSVTNYEVDKTVRVTRNATGTVKRLNAAVVVNDRVTTSASGKVTSTPLPQQEIDKLTALVQETIGYSKERGDSVKVINAPFKTEPAPKPQELPLWKQEVVQDTLRVGAAPAALALVALAVVFGLLRPAVKGLAAPAKARQLDAMVADELALPAPPALEPPKSFEKLTGARTLAKDNPAAVANIVRGWVSKETA